MFDFVYDNCDVENTIEINVPKIDFGDNIKLVSPVEWEEHCLECSAPLCYESCHMFEKGKYNLCKRTEYGIKRISNIKYGLYKEPILLSYKRWGKLHAKYYQNVVLTKRKYSKIEQKSFENRGGAEYLPRCSKIMKHYIEKKLKWTNRIIRPFIFIFSLGNKKVETRSFCDGLAFSIASTSKETEVLDLDYMRKGNSITKRQLIIKPGTINNFLISFNEMPGEFDSWDLYPNSWKEKIDFCFFCADIVKMKKGTSILLENDSTKAYEKIKCVVWDLDNTIWKGIIGEAGSDKILIREDIVDIIKQLDERGIISCICSKNGSVK